MRLVHISEVLAQMNYLRSEIPPELRPMPVPTSRQDRRREACDQRYRRAARRAFG